MYIGPMVEVQIIQNGHFHSLFKLSSITCEGLHLDPAETELSYQSTVFLHLFPLMIASSIRLTSDPLMRYSRVIQYHVGRSWLRYKMQ
jgi:hypothetical protein